MFARYKPFLKAGAMDSFAFRIQLWSWVIISALQIACVVFLWIAVYQNSPNGFDSVIRGFTFKEMICYVVFTFIFSFVTFSGETIWYINEDIKRGTIDLAFTKPISYRVRFIFQTLGGFLAIDLIIGLPLLIISYLVFSLTGFLTFVSPWLTILNIAAFLVLQIMACILYDTLNYIAGVLCFYTSSGWGINQAKDVVVRALSGGLIPLSFVPGIAGKILMYTPFSGMSYTPILVLLNKVEPLMVLHYLGFNLSWIGVLSFLGWLLFNHASKKITVQGG